MARVFYSSSEPRLKLGYRPNEDGTHRGGYQHTFFNGSLIYDDEVEDHKVLIADLDDRLSKHDNLARLIRKLSPQAALDDLAKVVREPVGSMVTGSLTSQHMHTSLLSLGAGEEVAIEQLMRDGASREDAELTVTSMRNGMAVLTSGAKTHDDPGAIKPIPIEEALGTSRRPVPDGGGDAAVAKMTFKDALKLSTGGK